MTVFDDSSLENPEALAPADPILRRLAEAGARVRRETADALEPIDQLSDLAQPRAVIAAGAEARFIRAMLEPVGYEGDLPRLPMLPVGPMIRWLVGNESEPRLSEHLSALVAQELAGHDGPVDTPGLVAFWERALPPVPPAPGPDDPRSEPALTEAWHVALFGRTEPTEGAGLATLLAPARRPLLTRDRPGPARERLASRAGHDQELPNGSGTADRGLPGPGATAWRGAGRSAPIRPPVERRRWWRWWGR